MTDIGKWLARSKLEPGLEKLLLQCGVKQFKDLDEFFMDENRLQKCKAGMKKDDFTIFAGAYLATMVVDNDSEQIDDSHSSSSSGAKRTLYALKFQMKQIHKRLRIAVVDRKLLESASLDVMIMLDCTGSMYYFLDAAKARISAFVKAVGETYPDIPLRIAFIGYRDIRDGPDRLVLLPFQKDLAAFERQLASMSSFGGGAPLTDLTGALKVASEQDWSSAIRALYHIGDYPCHGLQYHEGLYDAYPAGDPYGLRPEAFVQVLASKKVNYCFGQLTPNTDKMIAVFNKYMGREYIKSSPMSNVTMMEVVTSSVTALLTTSLSSTSSTSSSGSVHSRECTVVPAMPADWAKIHTERAVAFTLTRVTSVDSLCVDAEKVPVFNDFPAAGAVYIKRAEDPFGKGRSKLAYYAQLVTGLSDNAPTVSATPIRVMKQSVYVSKAFGKLEMFEEFLAPQRAALYLSGLYNKARPAGTPSVEFVTTRLLQFLARPDKPYYIEEAHITGKWERYNNNTGYCAPFPTALGTNHHAVQAFSHWTHHVSGGRLMITDCQGWFDAARNCFVLTDPAVHCASSLLGYGGTNMGERGFERFFKTHRCNDVCRALHLTVSALDNK